MSSNQEWRHAASIVVKHRADAIQTGYAGVHPIVARVLKHTNIKPGKAPIMMADENISQGAINYILDRNIPVIDIRRTELAKRSDQELFEFAQQNVLMILTHDHDFRRFDQFDYNRTAGVVLLPTPKDPNIKNRPSAFEPLRLALAHLTHNVGHAAEYYGTVQEYGRDGKVTVHKPPYNPGANPQQTSSWYKHDYFAMARDIEAGQIKPVATRDTRRKARLDQHAL